MNLLCVLLCVFGVCGGVCKSLVAAVAVLVDEFYEPANHYPLQKDGHDIFGFLVGFLLVFRTTIAYGRYSDGSTLLGLVSVCTRCCVLFVLPFVPHIGSSRSVCT